MFQLYTKLKWAYQKFRVSYSLPFIALVSYTLLGAVLFRNIELEADVKRRAAYRASTEFAFNEALKQIMTAQCNETLVKTDPELATRHAKQALFFFIDYLNLTQIIEERSSVSTPWTWMGSAFYSGQLYTTIGYGYPLVHTSTGQVVTIFYIMVGIPIFLIILKDVGKLLSRALRKVYKRWVTAKNKIPDNAAVRRMSEPVKAIYSIAGGGNGNPPSTPTKSLTEPTISAHDIESGYLLRPTTTETTIEMGTVLSEASQSQAPEEPLEPVKRHSGYANFPIPLALFILLAWILLSAGLFCVWETEWGYLTSIYFFFVSISTVGLGDIVPLKPDMMLVNFVLILIGLALLSMCVNLIQDAIEKIIEQLLQEYIEEIEKMAAIVTTDNDFVEETATPFEIGMSADLLTAPLKAYSKEQEAWFKGMHQKAKDWMAEKLVDKIIVQQLDTHSSDSEDDEDGDGEEELDDVVVDGNRNTSVISSVQKDALSKASKKKKKRLLTKRGNFTLNYNLPTLRTLQAMEKVKLNTNSNNTFRGKLFAKFASNKKFKKYLDEHVAEPEVYTRHASIVGMAVGGPQRHDLEQSPDPWRRIKLVTPESTIKGSISTASTFDVDSLYSVAYHDVTFGYSTDSVPKLIEREQQQQEEEVKRNQLLIRRASKDSRCSEKVIPTLKEILVVPPPLAEDDEQVKIEVKKSSESPQPEPMKKYSLEPSQAWLQPRRASSPGFNLQRGYSNPDDSRSHIPMMRCPSCLHMATAASATAAPHQHHLEDSKHVDPELESMKRIRDLCGLLPGDFAALPRRSLSPPHLNEDSGYDNSLSFSTEKDSPMTDSATGRSMTTSLLKSHLEDEIHTSKKQ